MPLYHCKKCHHEWEGSKDPSKESCDWCGGGASMLEEETPLEKMLNPETLPNLLNELIESNKDEDTRKE